MTLPKDPAKMEAYRKKQADNQRGKKQTQETISKIRASHKAYWEHPESRETARQAQLKRYSNPEQRRLHSERSKELRMGYWNKGKERNPNSYWSNQYRIWRAAILERDGSICQNCGSDQDIVTHHIKPWKDNPDLRFDVANGITLCRHCHGKHHTPKGALVGANLCRT